MRQTGYLARPPTSTQPPEILHAGRVRELVIHFKFHENRSRGLGAVEGRKSPSPTDLAHGLYNSLYYRKSRNIIAGMIKLRPLTESKPLNRLR